jgi:hypothetical protein
VPRPELRSGLRPIRASGTPGHRARAVRDIVREPPNGGSEVPESRREAAVTAQKERDAELEEALSDLRLGEGVVRPVRASSPSPRSGAASAAGSRRTS